MLPVLASILFLLLSLRAAHASLDLTIHHYGLSLGNSPRVNGLRVNLRDRHVEQVNGLNLTLWKAGDNLHATYNGLFLGLIAPEGGDLNGLAMGAGGVVAHESIRGIALGGFGAGAGKNLDGVAFGFAGAGAGGTARGLILGGLGAGAGKELKGVALGGIGAGVGQSATGLVLGGIGAGVGQSATGLVLGGIGAGAGEDIEGIVASGVFTAAGNDMTGLSVGLGGVRAEGAIRGVALSLVSVGAREQKGVTFGLLTTGFVVEDYWFRRFNRRTTGLSIGLLNYAPELRGAQFGLLNYAGNNPRWARLLPLLNLHL